VLNILIKNKIINTKRQKNDYKFPTTQPGPTYNQSTTLKVNSPIPAQFYIYNAPYTQ